MPFILFAISIKCICSLYVLGNLNVFTSFPLTWQLKPCGKNPVSNPSWVEFLVQVGPIINKIHENMTFANMCDRTYKNFTNDKTLSIHPGEIFKSSDCLIPVLCKSSLYNSDFRSVDSFQKILDKMLNLKRIIIR